MMKRLVRATACLVAAGWGAGVAPRLVQALEPDQVAVIFNTQSALSLRVARHYMDVRKIPPTHLLPVTVPVGEVMSEETYR